jgi:hypothetical protein
MVLGAVDDFYYRWVADVGITGADKGKGGKYLILPPGYTVQVPDGFFVLRPPTYGNRMPFRRFLVKGSPIPGVDSVQKDLKIYQFPDAANPPAMKFANLSGIPSNVVAPGDYSFWGLLNEVIQEEPSAPNDPTMMGLFASIGIEKGKPFDPDARMKKILMDAANIGAVTARTIAFKIRPSDAYIYPNSAWRVPYFGGYQFLSGLRAGGNSMLYPFPCASASFLDCRLYETSSRVFLRLEYSEITSLSYGRNSLSRPRRSLPPGYRSSVRSRYRIRNRTLNQVSTPDSSMPA